MSKDRWLDKEDMVHMHNGLLSHKKGWNYTICNNMDGPRADHTKWSKSEKEKYHMISLICGIWRIMQINLFTKEKQSHRHRKQTYGYQRGKEWGIN